MARHDQSDGSGRSGAGRPVEPARQMPDSERLLTQSPYFQGPLHERLSDDLHLAGMARRTHEGYLLAVRAPTDDSGPSLMAVLAVAGRGILDGQWSRSAAGTRSAADPRVHPVRRSSTPAGHHGRLRTRRGWRSPGSTAGTGRSCHRISGQRIAPMTRLRHDRSPIFETRCQPCPFRVCAEAEFGQYSGQCRLTERRISRRNAHRQAAPSPPLRIGRPSGRVSGHTEGLNSPAAAQAASRASLANALTFGSTRT